MLKLLILVLSFLHSAPIYITVNVIDEKCKKANNNGNVSGVIQACHYPQYYQYNIV